MGCNTMRYVPADRLLLSSNELTVADTSSVSINLSELRNYVRQSPNSKWFSLFKLPLATYSLAGRDTTRWLNRTLQSIGEPPVLFDTTLAAATCRDLSRQLQNRGYLNATVDFDSTVHKRRLHARYVITAGEPYFIGSITRHIGDSNIARLMDSLDANSNSLIREGQMFDVTKLDDERKRLTNLLRNNGYYRFHKDYVGYYADTLSGSRLVDLHLNIAALQRQNRPDTLHTRYTIRRIGYNVSPSFEDSARQPRTPLRKRVLDECTHITAGKPFSATALQDTYNHFSRLQAVKYTRIHLTQVPDTSLLDCNIELQTNKNSTLSFEPEGTNTAGDLGAAAKLTYQHRNLFRGSEVLSVTLRGAYEAIRGLEGYSNQDFIEYSLETRLSFPRILAPFASQRVRQEADATSEVSLLYDLQDRPEFHRRVLAAAWSYKWHFTGQPSRFQFDLLDLNYVFMPWISPTFRRDYLDNESSRNAILRYNYADLFITKVGFSWNYSRKNLALRTNIETSGNLLYAGAHLFRAGKNERDEYRLFNIAFAQYAKADFSVTRSIDIDTHNQIVFHLGLGIAYPYGNSTILPFEKRYFAGGANSVRGWTVRSLGPGRFKSQDGRINFINQTGDMKLDISTEYRTHVFWKLDGAIFADAGNVWTLRNYPDQPGGQFRFNDFLSQMAVSYGAGLRFNFDYFILRFDLGMKAINPVFDTSSKMHYPILKHNFSRDYAFHFAVGMPF